MTAVPLHAAHDIDFSAWHFEPTVIAGVLIVLVLYAYGAHTLGHGLASWRTAAFVTGIIALFVSLASPLDAAADRLLSMHMLQHVALTTIGPPLMLLGLTPALLHPLLRGRKVGQAAKLLTHPVFAATLFVLNMWFWHVPPIYGGALDYMSIHITMHLAFMVTGVLFWWPVIQPSPLTGRLGEGGRILYLIAAGMPIALLAMLFFASSGVIYDHYATVEKLWGIGPIDDQQVAGLIMGGLGEVASFAAVTLLFFRLLDREEEAESAEVPGRIDGR